MDNLALKGVHWLQSDRVAGAGRLLRLLSRQGGQFATSICSETLNIEHKAASIAGRCLDGEAGELLD